MVKLIINLGVPAPPWDIKPIVTTRHGGEREKEGERGRGEREREKETDKLTKIARDINMRLIL